MSVRRPEAVVFDLGGVLVDWDPRRLYRTMLGSDEEIADFFDEVDFAGWNHRLDAGERTWAEAVDDLGSRFPHRRELLAAYPARFPETLGGVIDGTVRVVEELHGAGVRLLALTNWSAELFPHARERFAFLRLFEAVVVSGEERLPKPDPRIYDLLLTRHDLDPAGTVFVDDRETNVEAARAAGMTGLVFTDPDRLRRDLARTGALGLRRTG
ncbi:MAG TPA: HAD family phosphatase [Actinomycetes bacterium]|nr:HAD family phosphatase [Actinomycetes bacterium]